MKDVILVVASWVVTLAGQANESRDLGMLDKAN